MTSSVESKPFQRTDDVSGAATPDSLDHTTVLEKASASSVGGGLNAIRVQDVNEVQNLLVSINDVWISRYILNHFRDPDTLIMRAGRSCFIASVVRHDLMADTAIVVWAQNPDHYPTRVAYEIINQWALSRGCHHVAAYIDPSSKLWQRMAATKRLLGLKPYKIVLSTGSDLI